MLISKLKNNNNFSTDDIIIIQLCQEYFSVCFSGKKTLLQTKQFNKLKYVLQIKQKKAVSRTSVNIPLRHIL